MDKYHAVATRKNVDGKPDYPWYAKYASGARIQFVSKTAAEDYAKSAASQPQHSMYNPRAELAA